MLYNYKYGNLIDGNIVYAPLNLEVNGVWYIPAGDQQYKDSNFCEIISTERPDDFGFYTSYWEQQEGKIVQVWEKQEDPVDTRTASQKREEAYETRLNILFPPNSQSYITIDDAVKLVYEYSCEETERANDIVSYLKEAITVEKQAIRNEFPDEEE